jgi:transposase
VLGGGRVRGLGARLAEVIRIDAVWLAVEPVDLRAGMDTVLARVVAVFGAAHPHQAHLFTNRRGNRLKVLVHDGFGVWLAVRRLHPGRFLWATSGSQRLESTREQFDALVLGLPWQRLGESAVINLV